MNKPQTTGLRSASAKQREWVSSYPDPDHPERVIDQDVARLSGGLFDSLPNAQVPLDSFFPLASSIPQPAPAPRLAIPPPAFVQRPAIPPPAFVPPPDSVPPPDFAPRSDSLYPMEADLAHPPPGAGHSPAMRWSGLVMFVAGGALAAAVLLRPAAPPSAPTPAAAFPPIAIVDVPRPAAAPETDLLRPVEPPPTAVPAAGPVLRGKLAKPAQPLVAAPAAPSASPEEAAPVQQLAPSPPTTVDPLHAASIDPPGLPTERAAVAIAGVARGAASCLEPGDPRRTMAVSVTFAPSGRVTRATVDSPPHRGTAAGSCIAQRLRTAVVKPFDGPPVTIRTSITAR